MNSQHISIKQAREIDIVQYLEKLGHQPQKTRNNDYWYLSPLRQEKEPSFKVNRKLNAWYDHGLGKGGNLVDFGILYHNCSVSELLKRLETFFSFHLQTPPIQPHQTFTHKPVDALESKIEVLAAKPLTHPSLCRYLDERKIPFDIANKYCKEVEFELNQKRYFAIGFENKSGGFELRNRHFKGSSSPKDVTQIGDGTSGKPVAVFEGFFSFLSYQKLHQNKPGHLTDFLVLNSLSFFEKSRQLMEKFVKIHLYLDTDVAGRKHTLEALKWSKKYVDESHCYKLHKDINDYLVSQSGQIKQRAGLGRHL